MSNKLFLDQLKSEAASAASGSIFGALDEAILGDRRRQKQLDQQRKLQDLQIKGNKQLMDYGYDQQLQMWEDTNYGAQMEQIKKAGLNPAMIYGSGGGGGGQLGAGVAGTVGSGEASNEAQQKMADNAMMQTSLDRRRQNAEIKLLEAQAGNIDKDTGVKEVTISSILEGIENTRVQRQGYVLENEYNELRNHIQGSTLDEAINNIKYSVNNLVKYGQLLDEQIDGLQIDNNIKYASGNSVIEQQRLMAENLFVDLLVKAAEEGYIKAKTGEANASAILKGEEAKVVVKDYLLRFRTAGQQDKRISIDRDRNQISRDFNAALKEMNLISTGGSVIGDIIGLANPLSKLGSRPNEFRGFGR